MIGFGHLLNADSFSGKLRICRGKPLCRRISRPGTGRTGEIGPYQGPLWDRSLTGILREKKMEFFHFLVDVA